MLGPRQADALGAELPALGCVLGRVGVGPHLQAADAVRPSQDLNQVGGKLRLDQRNLAEGDLAGVAVDRDDVALDHPVITHCELALVDVDLQRLGAADARLAGAPGDDRGVEVLPPREVRMPWAAYMPPTSSGSAHRTNQDDLLPCLGHPFCRLGVEDCLAHCRAR